MRDSSSSYASVSISTPFGNAHIQNKRILVADTGDAAMHITVPGPLAPRTRAVVGIDRCESSWGMSTQRPSAAYAHA